MAFESSPTRLGLGFYVRSIRGDKTSARNNIKVENATGVIGRMLAKCSVLALFFFFFSFIRFGESSGCLEVWLLSPAYCHTYLQLP